MRQIDKPWGYERIWAQTENYVGKILFVKKDCRLSLQHHAKKMEDMLVVQGHLLLELHKENGVIQKIDLKVGDTVHIAPKQIHRLKAYQDSKIIEVSTTELEDIIRHEDDYGRTKSLDNESGS
jgi:mannose-6-phosphate isomerase